MNLKAVIVGFVIFILTFLSSKSVGLPTSNSAVRLTRSEPDKEQKFCSDPLPCSWGVYGKDPNKRIKFQIENNSCVCGEGRKCLIAEENLSMGAFVFRCKPDNLTTTTPENSEDPVTE